MNGEDFLVQFIPSKNGFLQFSNKWYQKMNNTRSSCLRIIHPTLKRELYFSCIPQPSFGINDCSVGINATFAQGLDIHENEVVSVTSVDAVMSLHQVFLSPFSADDYEILESSRDIVEVSLLNQIRVVYVGQVISVWVSKSMHLRLIVDQLGPSSTFGRLEQMTELFIETVAKAGKPRNAAPSSSLNSNSITPSSYMAKHQEAPSFWSLLSGYIPNSVFDKVKPNDNLCRTKQIGEQTDATQLVCRVHPLPAETQSGDCCGGVHNETLHPFNVFVPTTVIDNSLLFSERAVNGNNNVCIYKLQAIPKKKVNSPSSKASSKNHVETLTESVLTDIVYVRLHLIPESCRLFERHTNISCVFVSKFLRKMLNLNVGSKVNLSVHVPILNKRLLEIKIIPASRMNESEAKELHEQFVARLACREGVLINNSQPLPVPSGDDSVRSVRVILSPDDIDCWPLTKAQLEVTPVVVSVDEDKSLTSLKDFNKDQENVSKITSVFTNLVEEGVLSLEYGLCLNDSKNQSLILDNILITGKRGSGKKQLAEAIVSSVSGAPHHIHVSTIDCKPLKGKMAEPILKILTERLEECVYYQPAVLVLHDVQCIAGSPTDEEKPTEETTYFLRLATMLKETLWKVRMRQRVIVMATAEHRNQLHPQLLSARGRHTFPTVLHIPQLQKSERQQIVGELLSARIPSQQSSLLELMAERTEGCVAHDLRRLVDRVLFKACQRSEQDLTVWSEDVEAALEGFVPVDLLNVSLTHRTGLTFSNVGGLDRAKRLLTEVLIWPTKFPEVFSQCPLRLERGVLLYGAPGTGKTLMAKAVVGESGLNSITVKGPELLSKYFGASEEAVRNIFQKAQSAQPCILFFDEFDSLAPQRGHDSTGVTDRVVNQLLTLLDGVEALEGVWVLAAASRPDLLDPALLRPGRIGTLVHCTLPDQEERLAILERLSGPLRLAEGVDLSRVAAITDGYTGADLQAVLFTAQMAAFDAQYADSDAEFEASSPVEDVVVSQEDLLLAVRDTTPSLKSEDILRFKLIYEKFQQTRGDSGSSSVTSDNLILTLA